MQSGEPGKDGVLNSSACAFSVCTLAATWGLLASLDASLLTLPGDILLASQTRRYASLRVDPSTTSWAEASLLEVKGAVVTSKVGPIPTLHSRKHILFAPATSDVLSDPPPQDRGQSEAALTVRAAFGLPKDVVGTAGAVPGNAAPSTMRARHPMPLGLSSADPVHRGTAERIFHLGARRRRSLRHGVRAGDHRRPAFQHAVPDAAAVHEQKRNSSGGRL